jgi:hypothetical protein
MPNPKRLLETLYGAKDGVVRMDKGGKLPPGVKRATEQADKSAVLAAAKPARQAIQGYLGMDPSYSVMDPQAERLASAYRTGEDTSVLGDLAGALSPFAYASALSKVGRVPGIAELIAYHGSPHKFKKFDASKIGTGEGAQAFGHGLYFAEAPEVAEGYARNLANRDLANQGRLNAHANAQRLAKLAGDPKYAADDVRFVLSNEPNHPQKRLLQDTLMFLESGDFAKPLQTKGSLYKVDIPDKKIAQMLDWDKPLSQQPAYVQEALKSSGLLTEVKDIPKIAAEKIRALADQPGLADWAKRDLLTDASTVEKSPSLKHVAGVLKSMQLSYGISPDSGPFVPVAKDFLNFVKATQMVPDIETGGGALGMLEAVKGGPREAAQALRDAGIPGIRYLDQGSRGTGKGTSNFVVFPGEEESIKMLEINGTPEMAAGGAVRMQDGGSMFNFNPMAAKAAKQKQMRESTPETPLGALARGIGTGLFGSMEDTVPYTGSIMEGTPERQQSQANLREIGRNIGVLTDIGGMTAPFVKPAAQLATRGAVGLGRAAAEQIDRAMMQGEGPLGALLAPVAPMQAVPKAQAPVSPLGFYNPVEQAALNVQRKQGPGQAFLNELQRGENVSKDFLQSSGLAERLAAMPNVTREEVQAMAKGTVPDVQQVMLGETVVPPHAKEWLKVHMPEFDPSDVSQIDDAIALANQRYDKLVNEGDLGLAEFAADAIDDLMEMKKQYKPGTKAAEALSKYGQYTVPGGENYREMLLTLPSRAVGPSLDEAAKSLFGRPYDQLFPGQQEDARRLLGSGKIKPDESLNYSSSHWDQPNVLSHVRMNDRTDAEGKKVLFIEELQSDWGQEGRKKGFADSSADAKYRDYLTSLKNRASELIMKNFTDEGVPPDRASQLTSQMIGRMEDWNFAKLLGETSKLDELFKAKRAAEEGVPSAPFVQNTNEWVDLSLKNILKRAVDEGYDRVAFINGKQSADRYQLTKYLDKLEFVRTSGGIAPGPDELGHGLLIGYDKNGHRVIEKSINNPEKELVKYAGKEVAQRLLEQKPQQGRFAGMGASIRSLEGQGLEIGGKGMKKFYDEIVPDRVRKLVGKNSLRDIQFEDKTAKLREELANATPGSSRYLYLTDKIGEIERDAERYGALGNQLGFDITPEIREKFSKPIPYKKGGKVKKVKVSKNPDVMRLELLRKKHA